MRHLIEPEISTEFRHDVDVLVVGGGAAGMAAAVSAARSGARVMLVEKMGFLGGTLTSVTLGSICGLYGRRGDRVQRLVRGFADEVVQRLHQRGCEVQPKVWLQTASLPYHPEPIKLIADDLMREEGIEVCLHSLAVRAIVEEGQVRGAVFESIDGRWAVRASCVVDASGDGQIAALAGAEWECDVDDLQFPTTMIRFGGVDTAVVDQTDRAALHRHLEAAVAAGYDLPRTAGGIFSFNDSVVHLNITRVSNNGKPPDPLSTSEMSMAEVDGRRMAELYLAAFRDHVPGYENAWLLDTGAQIGVRESRRITGDYVLTEQDVLGAARFDDAIGCCAWPVEEHGADRATRWVWMEDGTFYQIPWRCLLPRGREGLIVAGRCASATHVAQASLRVAGTCFAMGEAAGLGAAMAAADHGGLVRSIDVQHLQAQLTTRGAFLGRDAPEEFDDHGQNAGSKQ
ncbi:FAD-dependent oxidoreductase [Roseovarius sp. ZX-A-9]|uniref:FAD-dependent oxidoreductase n=1 Tax=Roseovarius sp. ZX-A-9 TaxID=3014783 RepID=UPI00232F0294|nr:FAD-dependent oxidoreductase [Roseovarius sp. ZX-A-9]